MSRQKGNRLERDVGTAFLEADGPHPIIGPLSTTRGRVGHLDLGADVISRRFSVECKNRESIGAYLWEWLDKLGALQGASVLVVKRNRRRPLAVLDLDDLLELIRASSPSD